MSFMLTTAQFRDRSKDVTRRIGWRNLKPGTLVMGCEQCQGIKPGELVRLGPIRILSNRWEPLHRIRLYPDDCRREGFPKMSPDEFIKMFCEYMDCSPDRELSRIVFEHPLDVGKSLIEVCPNGREVETSVCGSAVAYLVATTFGTFCLQRMRLVADEDFRLVVPDAKEVV